MHESPAVDRTGRGSVSTLQPGQHGVGAAALAAGHANYPAFRHAFPVPERRARALRAFFEATVRDAIPFGSVLAVPEGDRVSGVAVWLPPGRFPWTPRRKIRAAPELGRVLLADPLAFPKFAHYGANIERAHPHEEHWYLEVLSVRPEHQRQGLGSRLVKPVLDRADADDVPCYLETSDPANVEFYRRFGFQVTNPSLEVIPGGPSLTAMRRAPIRSAPSGRS